MKPATHDIKYKLIKRLSTEHVELTFSGTLYNQPVNWHARIRTLRDYCLDNCSPDTASIHHTQPFIDIRIENNIHWLTVALNLPEIDEPAILRTIIMIRQYKRLQLGRHHYGDIATFRFDIN